MTTLTAILLATSVAGAPRLRESEASNLGRIIDKECAKFAIPALVVVALIARESSFHGRAVNPRTGAVGLMQLVASPELLRGGFERHVAQLTDPGTNIHLGVRWLARWREKCGGDIWRATDGFNGRGCRRRTLSRFASEIKQKVEGWE